MDIEARVARVQLTAHLAPELLLAVPVGSVSDGPGFTTQLGVVVLTVNKVAALKVGFSI